MFPFQTYLRPLISRFWRTTPAPPASPTKVENGERKENIVPEPKTLRQTLSALITTKLVRLRRNPDQTQPATQARDGKEAVPSFVEARPDTQGGNTHPQVVEKGGKEKSSGGSFFSRLGMGQEINYLVENLSMLLSSGMVITLALASIKRDIRSKQLRSIIEGIETNLENGNPLWESLREANLFPPYAISLIRVGEQSGKLGENLQVIANQQQKERELKSKINSAMMYPMFVFGLTAVIGLGIAWFILPNLANVFTQLRIPLPLITKILIGVGGFLGTYGAIAIPAVLALMGTTVYVVFFHPKTNKIGQALLFMVPPIRKIIQQAELSRLGYILGTLLNSGLPIVDSLYSLSTATTSYRYQKLYQHLKGMIEDGNSLQKSLSSHPGNSKLIPLPIQQLLISAEQSGNISGTLMKISEIFEGKLNDSTKNLTVILEPILLVVVWLGVVAVAVAVILPLYSMIGNFNGVPQ